MWKISVSDTGLCFRRTTPETHPEILPGQMIVVPIYPRLPAKVTQITSMTPASLDVKIEYDDGTGPKSTTQIGAISSSVAFMKLSTARCRRARS